MDFVERNDDIDNLFILGIFLVDIYERLIVDRLDWELFLVLLVIFEMMKKMEVLRKFWEGGFGIGWVSNLVGVWEEILCIFSLLIVGMFVVEFIELRFGDD